MSKQTSKEYQEIRTMCVKGLGAECKKFRTEVLEMTRKQVSEELGTTVGHIQHFEKGENDSATVLCWYISKGLMTYTQAKHLLYHIFSEV